MNGTIDFIDRGALHNDAGGENEEGQHDNDGMIPHYGYQARMGLYDAEIFVNDAMPSYGPEEAQRPRKYQAGRTMSQRKNGANLPKQSPRDRSDFVHASASQIDCESPSAQISENTTPHRNSRNMSSHHSNMPIRQEQPRNADMRTEPEIAPVGSTFVQQKPTFQTNHLSAQNENQSDGEGRKEYQESFATSGTALSEREDPKKYVQYGVTFTKHKSNENVAGHTMASRDTVEPTFEPVELQTIETTNCHDHKEIEIDCMIQQSRARKQIIQELKETHEAMKTQKSQDMIDFYKSRLAMLHANLLKNKLPPIGDPAMTGNRDDLGITNSPQKIAGGAEPSFATSLRPNHVDPENSDSQTDARVIMNSSIARQKLIHEIKETNRAIRESQSRATANVYKSKLTKLQLALEDLLPSKPPPSLSHQTPPYASAHIETTGEANKSSTVDGVGRFNKDEDEVQIKKSNEVGWKATENPSDPKDVSIANVIAPVDLPENYRLDVVINKEVFTATVPKGGVTEGTTFSSTMVRRKRMAGAYTVTAVIGRWRDGVCDCFDVGLFHPILWAGCCFPQVVLAQILTRMKLTWFAEPGPYVHTRTAFAMVVAMPCVVALMNASVLVPFLVRHGNVPLLQIGVLIALDIAYLLYFVYAVARARMFIRSAYLIPEKNCAGCEDLACSIFCTCCTLTQMGRHTADYASFRGKCCSSSGLPKNVKITVPPMHDQTAQSWHEAFCRPILGD